MDTKNQVAPESATQTVQSEVKKCNHIPIIVVLSILAVCGFAFGGFELYNNMQSKNRTSSSEIEGLNNNDINQEDDNKTNTVISGNASFNVPNPPYDEGTNDGIVKFEYGIYDGILFTYSISYHLHPYGHVISEVVSNNIDINTGEKLNNAKVLERTGIIVEDVYRKILENLVDTVSIDSFFLDTQGGVSGETISVNEFKNNINEYVEQLKDDQDIFYILLKDSAMTVSYVQSEILKELGMSSLMDQGLVRGYVEIEL